MALNFFECLAEKAMKIPFNFYDDNFDAELSQPSRRIRVEVFLTKILRLARKFVTSRDSGVFLSLSNSEAWNYYLEHFKSFQKTFDILSDNESKLKLIELLLYRAYGPLRVKLSLNTESYWHGREKVSECVLPGKIPMRNFRSDLSLYDLTPYGFDLRLYFVDNGIYVDFVLQQYNYNNLVCVEEGDIVIDAGACWGDTALYFSSRGAKAVYSFEFIPSNLSVFERNIAMNPHFKDRIHIVKRPVWSESNIPLSYVDRGPASQVAEAGVYQGNTRTLSIDDFVSAEGLKSVDFIKMDIEGAELPALMGASRTVREFKPKLAIAVYHKDDDMITIPEYLRSLNPSYDFYLDYYTIVGHEIMLYAIDRSK
ncbi:MAG: FkbM family methyltransferase [Gammaproteobacteria bacterium]|nr:MAG: FkbM family methyltransferase [Gammaproteobacteria bacterium]